MGRFRAFWSGLSWFSRLQYLILAAILALVFWLKDLNPKNTLLGRPLWQFTVVLILFTIGVSRLLLPMMIWRPQWTSRILSTFGLGLFVAGYYGATQWWGRTLLAHFGFTMGLWLDAGCWFWFISELRGRAESQPTDVEEDREPV